MSEEKIATRAEVIAWALAVDWRDWQGRPVDAGGTIPNRLMRSLVNDFQRAHPGVRYPF